MALPVAARGMVSPFHVMRIVEAAGRRRALGLPVYELSAGQPSTPAPGPVLTAARATLGGDRLGYTAALGLPALRTAIAGHYRDWYDLEVDPSSVAVTTGSSGGFLLALLAAFAPGDRIAVTRPGYPAYRNLVRTLGGETIELDCGPASGFRLTRNALEAVDEPPDGLIIGSPANPTGSMIEASEFAGIVDWCVANSVRLISDEIYHGISYGAPAACAWAFDPSASHSSVVIGSFSKYFSMTGWRLGWLLLPPELVDPVDRLAGNFALCPPTLSQYAALGAFSAYGELDANVERYRLNRELLTRRLPQLGIDSFAPVDGAFYVYADVSKWTDDSLELATRLLDDTGVAVASGIDFDEVDGGSFIRLCFAGDHDDLVTALDLMAAWLAAAG